MARKFTKGELVKQGNRYGVVKEEKEDSVDVETADGTLYGFYLPEKITKTEIKERVSVLKNEVKFLERFI